MVRVRGGGLFFRGLSQTLKGEYHTVIFSEKSKENNSETDMASG
jgi:hypothetical protein